MTSCLSSTESTPHGYTKISSHSVTRYGAISQDSQGIFEDGNAISEEGRRPLRRISDSLPMAAWLVIILEMCERVAFVGLMIPLQNYIQNPTDDLVRPGGLGILCRACNLYQALLILLGLGQAQATRLNQFFTFWCYLTPTIGALVADQYLGRVKTIIYSSLFYMAGLAILCFTSLPIANHSGISLAGLVVAMILIGVGTGGIKPNAICLLAEQYKSPKNTLRIYHNGEKAVVDSRLTTQR